MFTICSFNSPDLDGYQGTRENKNSDTTTVGMFHDMFGRGQFDQCRARIYTSAKGAYGVKLFSSARVLASTGRRKNAQDCR
jgi:hypothetical protein